MGAAGPLVALLAALALAVAVGLASPWVDFAADPVARVESDFQILHAAGRGLVEGRDIHDPAVLDAVGRADGRQHTPFCAANPLVVRLYGLQAGTPLVEAYGAALTVGIACALAAAALLADVLRRAGLPTTLAVAVVLASLALPEGGWMSLAMNSTNLPALLAVSLALHGAARGSTPVEGLGLAAAALAKTSPALLLLVVAVAGRGRAAVAALLAGAGAVAASVAWSGWSIHESWLTRVLPVLGYAPELEAGRFQNSLHAWNLAPNGFLSRAFHEADAPRVAAWGAAWVVTLLVIVQLVVAVRAARAARRDAAGSADAHAGLRVGAPADARGSAREALWLYGLGLAATLLVSSVSWPHHLVFLVPASCWMLLGWLEAPGEASPARLAATAALVLLALPLGILDGSPALEQEGPLRTAALVVVFAALTRLTPGGESP